MVTDGFQSRTSLRGVEPLLVRACRREPVERTPVWFMRQAGRSLPEYRELRKRYGLFDIVAEPELCAEVTLQPVRRHDVDAAVMFTDIMAPVVAMGVASASPRIPNTAPSTSWLKITTAGGIDTARAWMSGVKR